MNNQSVFVRVCPCLSVFVRGEFYRMSGKPILVIGGGIAGMTAAIEAAEAGCSVVLIEKKPYLGGRVAQMNHYFPKLCPPACGLEINFQRIRSNPAIEVLTVTELEALTGTPGDYEATIRTSPRFISGACTGCGDCTAACPVDRADDFNFGYSRTKAAYLPYPGAFPATYVIDRTACRPGCKACADACRYGAVDLAQKPATRKLRVSAVVAATGWAPYDATKLDQLGFRRYPNVVTNMIFERLAAGNGPTGGKILRPSDNKAPASVAFVQCAGSRDENHLGYCSSVCCAASLKHVTYIRSQYPDAEVAVFYIDIRTPGLLEDFYQKAAADPKLQLIKGKVAKVEEDPATGDLLITAEDVLQASKIVRRVNLVVLATGIVPQGAGLPDALTLDEFGFASNGAGKAGVCAAGCLRRPADVATVVRGATGAALKAMQAAIHHG